jgi:hypothetical protein
MLSARSFSARRLAPPIALLFAVACDCAGGGGGLTGATPIPEVDQEVLDFGAVEVGAMAELDLQVSNLGQGSLDVARMEITSPDAGLADWFHARPAALRVNAGGTGRVTVSFMPLDVGAAEARLILHTNAEDAPTREVVLRGVGYIPTVTVEPTSLDFGNVVTDSSRTLEVTLENVGTETSIVRIGTLAGQSAGQYRQSLPSEASAGALYLEAGQTARVQVTFAPTLTGRHLAGFTVDPCDACPPVQVGLTGVGIDTSLIVEPGSIDFGAINPRTTATQDITFHNRGNLQIRVTSVLVQGVAAGQPPDEAFALEPFDLPIVLEAGETAHVTATFTPPGLQTHYSAIAWQATDTRNPEGRVLVVGRGGGPTIDVTPEALAFGPVAIGTSMQRRVVVSNIGYDDLLLHGVEIQGSGAYRVVSELHDPILPVGDFRWIEVEFAPTDEQDEGATLVVHSNDQGRPQVEVPLSGEGLDLPPCAYVVSPDALRFGIIERNRTRTLEFGITAAIENEGDCLVSILELEPGSDSAFGLPDGDVIGRRIAPGETWLVPVAFSPTDHGNFTGSARFYASSPTEPEFRVPLTGSARQTDALVAPDELDFGVVEVGCSSREREICVYNTGQGVLHLTDVEIVQAGPDVEFTIRSVPPGMATPQGQPIATGARACVTVAYRPESEGADNAALYLTLAEYDEPFLVVLTGEGATDAVQTDRFVQLERPLADILFVIDDSCSMNPYQTTLAQNLEAFMEFAIEQDIDYQVGVITTDGRDSHGGGILRPLDGSRPRIVTPRLTDPLEVFRQNVAVGTSGDAIERGFWSAEKALTDPILNDPTKNGGFIREDASLALIFISDEPEQSANSVDYYLNIFMSVKGFRRPELFTASSIVSTQSGCAFSGPHYRYIEVAERTGGVVSSICSTDWATDLRELSTVAFGFKSRFHLTSTPVPETIEVEIIDPDGGSSTSEFWSYNPETNSVEFHPLAIPEPGDTVEVTYEVSCLP